MATCCFTGHRPEKLGGYDYNSPKNKEIKKRLEEACKNLIQSEGVDTFIVGGALGIDQMAFDVVYSLKETYDLKIVVAIPFKNQASKWPISSVNYYNSQLSKADSLVYVDTLERYAIKGYTIGDYYPAKMQKRNEYMVDNSDFIIAYFDGSKGGTANCLKYWERVKDSKPINIF